MSIQVRTLLVIMTIILLANIAAVIGFSLILPTNSMLSSIFLDNVIFNGLGWLIVIQVISGMVLWLLIKKTFVSLNLIMQDVSRLGTGDLTLTINHVCHDTFGQIIRAFNDTISKLRTMVSVVKGEAEKLSNASVGLANVTNEAKRAVEGIAKSTSEIAGGSHEIGKMAQEAAKGTDHVSRLVRTTADRMQVIAQHAEAIGLAANAGQVAIQDATQTITKIASHAQNNANMVENLGARSNQVRDILAMINTVTKQTNEAARAGEYGRGFAVVATEVHKLAEQSQEAAQQINSIIDQMLVDIDQVIEVFRDTSQKMDAGVTKIKQASNSFSEIARYVEPVRIEIQDVARLADEQAGFAEELKKTVDHVASISQEAVAVNELTATGTQQVSASIDEIANNARSLSRLAGELEQAVAGFRLSDKKLIRVAFSLSASSPSYIGMQRFNELIKQKTNGRYELKIYHSTQLGEDEEILNKMKNGLIEMTFMSSTPIAAIAKEFILFDFPFLFKDECIADKVLQGPFGAKILSTLDDYGFHGLAFAENGFRDLTNSLHEVCQLEDFRELKIRTMVNQVHMDTFTCLGAKAVPVPFGQLYSSLSQHVVDGQENPLSTIYSSNFYEVQKYLTLSHHVYTPFVMMYSRELWNKLPETDKTMIEAIAKESALYTTKFNREMTRNLIPELEKKGMKISRITDSELERIRRAVSPVYEKHKEQVQILLDELLKEIGKS